MYERCRALLAAGRGLPGGGRALGGRRRSPRAEATGRRWDLLEALRARGIAALLAHEPARAAESLRAGLGAHASARGSTSPARSRSRPSSSRRSSELGELDEARAVTDRLRELAERQEHPGGSRRRKRCDALVRLASRRYDEDAAAALGGRGRRLRAARPALRPRRGRCSSLGRAQRRFRKWGAARDALEQAAAAFDELGLAGLGRARRARSSRASAPAGRGRAAS